MDSVKFDNWVLYKHLYIDLLVAIILYIILIFLTQYLDLEESPENSERIRICTFIEGYFDGWIEPVNYFYMKTGKNELEYQCTGRYDDGPHINNDPEDEYYDGRNSAVLSQMAIIPIIAGILVFHHNRLKKNGKFNRIL